MNDGLQERIDTEVRVSHDVGFPLPWVQDGWKLRAANGRQVAEFTAYNDNIGTLAIAERHCRMVVEAINGSAPRVGPDTLPIAPTYNHDDIRVMQRLIVLWADGAFPNRTPAIAFMKLFSEIGEFIDKPSAHEFADIMVLLLDLASMFGITDIGQAVYDKMKVNSKREWAEGAMGVMKHIDPPTAPQSTHEALLRINESAPTVVVGSPDKNTFGGAMREFIAATDKPSRQEY